jgi:hypothetical protein
MFRLKRVVAIVLLVVAIGVGAPQVFAEDGPTETPGTPVVLSGPTETPGITGPTETPGQSGPTETPGIVNDIIYLLATLIP